MSDINFQENVSLAPYTSFGVGGNAEKLVVVRDTEQLLQVLVMAGNDKIWLLGYGSNTLISDSGLDGTSIVLKGGSIQVSENEIIADAGVWWDDVVQASIEHSLWGIELLSEVPGSVGAAVFINIAAYGQNLGEVVSWVDVWDPAQNGIRRMSGSELEWSYKKSVFQLQENAELIILRVCLALSEQKTTDLTYQKALDVADELQLDSNDLHDRRSIIVEARKRAGSLWSPEDGSHRTAGSFFRNPHVTKEQLEQVISYEEHGKTPDQIKQMNKVHGGHSDRVSAAHVMLAAGFSRGQSWGKVKLNEHNVLKIEAQEGATAADIFAVMQEIMTTVERKLGITLQPEVRLLGEFS